jgi:hypothetical protein
MLSMFGVGVDDGVVLDDDVPVGDGVAEVVGVAVMVEDDVAVMLGVAVSVGVAVTVDVAVRVGVAVAVGVAVRVAVDVAVEVGVAVIVGVAVAVAVGEVTGVPKATPLSFTFCGDFSASSAISRLPLTLVPLDLLALTGLNVTETWQSELAATELSQPLVFMAKAPDEVIEVMANATELGLLTVTVLALETVSTATLPNESEDGLIAIFPAAPVPVKAIDLRVASAESPMTRLADLEPSAVGVKVSVTSHPLPGESVAVQLVVELKSPGLAPVI